MFQSKLKCHLETNHNMVGKPHDYFYQEITRATKKNTFFNYINAEKHFTNIFRADLQNLKIKKSHAIT